MPGNRKVNYERANKLERSGRVAKGLAESHLKYGNRMLQLELSEKDILALSGKSITSSARLARLKECGVVDESGRITPYARRVFSLPSDAYLRLRKPKGHWPKGRPRSTIPSSLYSQFLRELTGATKTLSLREIGRRVGKDAKQISKWVTGKNRPTETMAKTMLARLAVNQNGEQ